MSMADIFSFLSSLLSGGSIFSLMAGGQELRVVRFSGFEGISSLFEFRVEVAAKWLDVEALLEEPALLAIKGAEVPRLIHGVVTEAEYVGEARHLDLFELTIVPKAHRLLHRHGSRLFQDKTTKEIVTEVLTQAGVPEKWFDFSLVETYAPRNYCVQYRESDFAFVSRLLEEDGIYYFFQHAKDKHVMVMADHLNAHPPIDGNPGLWFDPQGGFVQDREHVRGFRFGGRVRAGKVALRDKNLHMPDMRMQVEEAAKDAKVGGDLEVYDFPGEYQQPGRAGPHEGQSMAKIRLESLQAMRRTGSGESDCPRLTPGFTMSLLGHPRHELNAEYRVVQVSHAGSQPQVLDQDSSGESSYHNSFVVTEKKVPYRPARTTPRPVMRGLQTATVVGPAGEEVHTDEHGRVRVKFHWDRSEPEDETCTCWVRVSQVWAGNNWGAMFLPRIGHEVLVDFIEGDPDRPVVTGRIYHGLNKPPYPLPAEKTKSTIKSESSIGGGGFNELRFEDRKGEEEVFLHAQKDWNTVILNNHTESVGANRSSTIGSNETITVGASRTSTISAAETITVGAGRTVSVGVNDATTVGAVHTVTIVPPPAPPAASPPGEGLSCPAEPPPPTPDGSTGWELRDKFYSVTTGLATVTIDGANVGVKAKGDIVIEADGEITIKGKMIYLNP
ncbi:MAG TPA: type VI secretion system Vgr family protein [Nannocystaceae bacterium]|nr:type VI secretion system Vgr family protein [Nannocystaceae bacterium]